MSLVVPGLATSTNLGHLSRCQPLTQHGRGAGDRVTQSHRWAIALRAGSRYHRFLLLSTERYECPASRKSVDQRHRCCNIACRRNREYDCVGPLPFDRAQPVPERQICPHVQHRQPLPAGRGREAEDSELMARARGKTGQHKGRPTAVLPGRIKGGAQSPLYGGRDHVLAGHTHPAVGPRRAQVLEFGEQPALDNLLKRTRGEALVEHPTNGDWVESGRSRNQVRAALPRREAALLLRGSSCRRPMGILPRRASPETAAFEASLGDQPDATRACMRRSTAMSPSRYSR